MKKIILAAMTVVAMFAMSDIASASVNRSKNTQYSVVDRSHGVTYHVENPPSNFLEQIFGNGSEWQVSPQPRWRNVRQARTYYKQQETTYFSALTTAGRYLPLTPKPSNKQNRI